VTDWKNQKISRQTYFPVAGYKDFMKIGKLQIQMFYLEYGFIYDDKNEFYTLLKKSNMSMLVRLIMKRKHLASRYNVHALDCMVERQTGGKIENIRIKMADIMQGDKIIQSNFRTYVFSFQQ